MNARPLYTLHLLLYIYDFQRQNNANPSIKRNEYLCQKSSQTTSPHISCIECLIIYICFWHLFSSLVYVLCVGFSPVMSVSFDGSVLIVLLHPPFALHTSRFSLSCTFRRMFQKFSHTENRALNIRFNFNLKSSRF